MVDFDPSAPRIHLHKYDGDLYIYWNCPGCQRAHSIRAAPIPPYIQSDRWWTWNGDAIRPSFYPSVRVNDQSGTLCHCFIDDGKITFLNDCIHNLRGTGIDMVPFCP